MHNYNVLCMTLHKDEKAIGRCRAQFILAVERIHLDWGKIIEGKMVQVSGISFFWKWLGSGLGLGLGWGEARITKLGVRARENRRKGSYGKGIYR